MFDINRYIDNSAVKREKIALDIKYGVLTKEDIQLLITDDRIKNAFIGTDFKNKKPKSEWNRQYLDELCFSVVAEGFNADYLWHLYDVKSFVSPNKSNISSKSPKQKMIFVIIGIIAVITLVLVLVLTQGNRKDVANDVSVAQTETIVTSSP